MLKGAILTMKGRFQILTDFKSLFAYTFVGYGDLKYSEIIKIPKTLCSIEFKYCRTNPKVSPNKMEFAT